MQKTGFLNRFEREMFVGFSFKTVGFRRIVWVLWLYPVFFFLFFCSASDASLSADYSYTGGSSTTRGETSHTSSLVQNYSLNVTKNVEFTRTIKGSADIRASKNIKHSNGRTDENTTLAPQLNLAMINPFFSISTSYQTNIINLPFLKILNGEKIEASNWSSSFSTAPIGYPTLTFGFIRSKSKTTDDSLLFKQDTTSDNFSAGTNYFITDTNMTYSFSTIKTRDNISGLQDKTPSHFANISYAKNFFDNYLSLRLGYSVSISDTTAESLDSEPVLANEKKEAEQGLFALSLSGADPGSLKLDRADSLANGDHKTPVQRPDDTSKRVDLLKENTNIGFKLVDPAKIHTIYLYVAFDNPENLTDQDETDIANADFGWTVYSSADNQQWGVLSFGGGVPRYDTDLNRFEMVISLEPESATSALYFKVVNTKAPVNLVSFAVTDIEGIGTTTDTKFVTRKSDFTGQFMNGGVSVNLTDKVSVGYNVNFDTTQSGSKTDTDTEEQTSDTDNLSQSVNLAWAFSRSLSLSSNILFQRRSTRSSSSAGLNDDTGVNTYSLSISSSPIDTINGSIGVNRSQNIRGKVIDSKTDSGNLNLFFRLYRKVELGFGYTINNSRNNANERDKTQTLAANLRMRPYRSLQIQLLGARFFRTVRADDTSNLGKPISSTLRSIINLTPSRYLSFSSAIEIEPDFKWTFSASSRLPGSLQVSIDYSRSDEGAESWSTVAYWNVSKYIYLSGNYRYSLTNNEFGDKSDRYSLRLSIRI